MGIRQTQIIGLPDRALDWLDQNVEKIKRIHRIYDGSETLINEWETNNFRTEKWAEFNGMHENESYPLERYFTVKRSVLECVQTEIWSSGPCIFLALKWEDTGEDVEGCAWTEDEINANV